MDDFSHLEITDEEIAEIHTSVKKSAEEAIREAFVINGYRPVDDSIEFSADAAYEEYVAQRRLNKQPTKIVNGFTPVENQTLSKSPR